MAGEAMSISKKFYGNICWLTTVDDVRTRIVCLEENVIVPELNILA